MPTSDDVMRANHRLARAAGLVAMAAMLLAARFSPSGANVQAQDTEPIKVVATFSILADWVQNVGGDAVEITTIVPAGGDAHTFDPNPQQVASIADADVIFEIGLGFETWLDDMVDASGSTAKRVVVSGGGDLLSIENVHKVGEGHIQGGHDPHIWGDVTNAIQAVDIIHHALAEIDPGNASSYDANAASYITELEDLNTYIQAETGSIPEDQRKLVTTHDTFGYFAHAYGFQVVGTALNSSSTEGGDPSASDFADLVQAIQDQDVPAIFAENVANQDLMEAIADEAGVTLAPTLYTDALGEPGSDGDTYIRMMTYNTDTITTALAGE